MGNERHHLVVALTPAVTPCAKVPHSLSPLRSPLQRCAVCCRQGLCSFPFQPPYFGLVKYVAPQINIKARIWPHRRSGNCLAHFPSLFVCSRPVRLTDNHSSP